MHKAVNFSRQKTSKIGGESRQTMQNSRRHLLTIVLLCTHPQHKYKSIVYIYKPIGNRYRPTFIHFSNVFLQISN